MSSVSSVETSAQQNFNPSWMRTNSSSNRGGFISSGGSRLSGAGAGYDDGGDDSTATVAAAHAILSSPVVSEYSYSRERLLELVPTGSIMPEALRDQLFFNENTLPLVSNTPLTDIEQKLQHNINSSKAMSMLSHSDRASIAAGAPYGSGYGGGALQNGQSPTNRWTPKSAWSKTTPERSSLGGSSASGRGGSSVGRAGGSFFAGRGGGRIGGDNAFGGAANGSERNSEESPSNPGVYQPKFSALRRGGGAAGVGRGGSTSGATFNTRADALYNPNDPTDRPKTVSTVAVARSESDDDEEGGWSKVGAPTRHGSSTTSAPTAAASSERPAWARSESWIQRQQASQQQQAAAAAAAAAASQQPAAQPPINHWNNREASGDSSVWSDRNQMVASVKNTADAPPIAQATPTSAPASAPAPAPPAEEEHEMSHLVMPSYAPNSSTWSNNVLGGGMGVFYQPPAPAAVVKEEQVQLVEFYYMDPTETHRGPFSKDQMNAWFKAGYFTDESLRVQRGKEGEYKTVGDLKKLHGVNTPFDYPEDLEKPARHVIPPPTVPTSVPSMSAFPSAVNPMFPPTPFGMPSLYSMQPSADVYTMMQTNYEQQLVLERKRLMEEHNRRLAEEAKKMQEFQEAMYRQMTMHQEASAQQLREQEIALARHREELERRDAELKQEALARQQKMEMEARELAERKAALEAEDRRNRLIEEQRQRQQEEEQRELAQREAAREAADRVRRAEEAAEKERIRLEQEARAAEEVIRQLRVRQEIEEREKVEQEKKRKLNEEREKLAKEAAERQQQAELEAVWGKKPTTVNTAPVSTSGAPKQVSPSGSDDSEGWTAANKKEVKHTKPAPWAAAVPVAAPAEKTLLEIQREEERQMKAEREQMAKLKAKEQAANLATAAAVEKEKSSSTSSWSGKSGWAAPETSSPNKSYVSPFLDGPSLESAHKQLQKKVSQPKLVPVKPAAPPAPVSKAKTATPVAAQKKKTKQETESEQFEQWFIKRFRQFSSTIDSKTLFDCIMNLENPNEVEDIVMSYLDESKTVKEFVREFIKRRIAMRAACGGGRPDVDDLTSARTAQAAPSDSNSGSNSNSGNGQGKKKKKTTKQVLDGNILGFRGAAASDRLNKGEIDAVPTAPVNPSRR